MDLQPLKNLGLTDSEIKVYLALLELGSSSKGRIVDKSRVASSKIYELLEKLSQKGLVSTVIQSGVKYFEAAPTDRIKDLMGEKKQEVLEQEKQLETLLPQLDSVRSLVGKGSETQVFKGMKGAKTAFDDILHELSEGDEYTVLGISKFTPHFERFVVHFHEKRATAGIKCRILVNELARETGEKLAVHPLTTVHYVKKELFTPVVFILYKDKTLISIGLDEIFIQIKSQNLTTGMLTYADYMESIGRV